jgi:hypothetical protein
MRVARLPTRPRFGLGWIGATTVGYAVALAAWEAASQPIWPALSGILGGSVTLALLGAALGVGAGLAQALALRQRLLQAGQWSAATTACSALGVVVAAWVAQAVSQALQPSVNKYVLHTAVNLSFGLCVGASVGAARWLVLRGSGAATARWIPVSAVAFALGYGTALSLLDLNILGPLAAPVFGGLLGALTGAVAALIEWLWLRGQPKAWPEATASPG